MIARGDNPLLPRLEDAQRLRQPDVPRRIDISRRGHPFQVTLESIIELWACYHIIESSKPCNEHEAGRPRLRAW